WLLGRFVRSLDSPPSSHSINPAEFVQPFQPSKASLHRRTTGESTRDGGLIRIFELATDRESGRDARDSYPEGLEGPRDVHRGGLAIDARARRDDDLLDRFAGQPSDQLGEPDVVGADPFERGQ